MKYGLNLLLWTDHMHDGMLPIVEKIKALGYHGIEMPIFVPDEALHRQWGKRLDDLGLERTAVTIPMPTATRSAPRLRCGPPPSMP